MRFTRRRVALGIAAITAAVIPIAHADASRGVEVEDITGPFVGPLHLAVAEDDEIYVSQSFLGTLSLVDEDEADDRDDDGIRTVLSMPGEVAGVATKGRTTIFAASDNGGPGAPPTTFAGLYRIGPGGNPVLVADLYAHEFGVNPDASSVYGFLNPLPSGCASQLPSEVPGASFNGGKDTHPYGVAIGRDAYYVAEAGGNAILRVDPRTGAVTTVAVLPAQPVAISDLATATALGLPACTVGNTFAFEAVPTDVEVGRDGSLYVTTLPGGPESAALGARGSVYRISPGGTVSLVATGFAGATNLAVTKRGTIYVTELFGNQVSRVVGTGKRVVVQLPSPAAIEVGEEDDELYVTYDVFGNGMLAKIEL